MTYTSLDEANRKIEELDITVAAYANAVERLEADLAKTRATLADRERLIDKHVADVKHALDSFNASTERALASAKRLLDG